MTLSALDARTALIVIDLQKGILALAPADAIAPVVKNAASLAAAFRARQLPVVLVNVAGGAPGRTDQPRFAGPFPDGWSDLIPELNHAPSDHLVTKHSWGAFTGTALEAWLLAQQVTQVVIGGVATSIGVESTARQAHECGFNVTLATDAMTDLNPDAHTNSITRIFPRLGQCATTAEIITLLGARA